MRSFFYGLLVLVFSAPIVMAQTDNAPSEDSENTPKEMPSEPKPETKDKAPETGDDLDEFFKRADEQLREEGQSCSPPAEPIA